MESSSAVPSGRARAIEEGLRAPCCWTQTLDIHESELARALRHEIAERVARGEGSESIRADLAARYGAEIIAVPAGSAWPAVAPSVMFALALMAVTIVVKARRWRNASRPQAQAARETQASVAYDEALGAALRALDD